ncbi:DNA-3-methyladenine glycosylase [Vibrio hannami]|uniref:DNA-3-methyladenine glycosylase family protein n=1 Tax=Vibrio hannami TaxID=2717094 RepID=UPI0024107D21|nr:DNA-3-methyladenine glycosylase [Vibrio hannami]MDG3086262.1 DNA-3-methyladenine glycosylase [Vibrio hannami]
MKAALEHLKQSDPVMKELIVSLPCPQAWSEREPFHALVESIVHQQLSIKAAATIWSRFESLFPENNPTPELLTTLSEETLRSAGLSRQKVKYVHSVAEFALTGRLEREYLDGCDNETVVSELTEIYGVGRWTVEMFLMSALARQDVFAPDDLIIQQSIQELYGYQELKGRVLKKALLDVAKPWAPYRTIACRYLWAWKNANMFSE